MKKIILLVFLFLVMIMTVGAIDAGTYGYGTYGTTSDGVYNYGEAPVIPQTDTDTSTTTSSSGFSSTLDSIKGVVAYKRIWLGGLKADTDKELKLYKEDIAIEKLTINFKEYQWKIEILIKRLNKTINLENVKTIQSLEITSNKNKTDFNYITIDFKVNKSLVEDKNKIFLYHKDNGWKKLPTEYIKSDTKYYYYQAEAEHLSEFLIGEELEEIPEEIMCETCIAENTTIITTEPTCTITQEECGEGKTLNEDLCICESYIEDEIIVEDEETEEPRSKLRIIAMIVLALFVIAVIISAKYGKKKEIKEEFSNQKA